MAKPLLVKSLNVFTLNRMKKKMGFEDLGGLVYSSEQGRLCPGCHQPVHACRCAESKRKQVVGNGQVRVGRSTSGRKGAGVTTVTGLPLDLDALKDLARQLKQKCGTGGTVKDGVVEIQGEHRDLVVAELRKLGYDAKRSGG